MSTVLTNILVPVDFTLNTEVAIKKAIELAHSPGSIIHLLHVKNPKSTWDILRGRINFITPPKENDNNEGMQKLKEWQMAIKETIPEAEINVYLEEGNVHNKIVQIAIQMKPQLIIIAKGNCHKNLKLSSAVYPNRLAKSTACPVLTIMRESLHSKIKTIVIPVRSFIPYRKIELAIAFAKKDRAKIHVVTLQNKMASWNTNRNYFIETYLLLKSRLTNTVEYHVLNGNDFPKATLHYAQHVGADMILANPWSETKIAGISGKHINDLILSSSKLQILSVEPFPLAKIKKRMIN